ncbi:MAG: UDP-N-acetylglucosamine 1-carboxyvinyltransferase [Lentisphaerae bacterium]|nr:UDP-N-acetylglucosamine 1-carboxyvinyltransferase [Lentisphaerota bacterium]
MARFIIRGGVPLKGRLRVPGNKNAALPMLAATVLTDEPVCLSNVPQIEDVGTMLELLSELGADVKIAGHTVTVCARGLRRRKLNPALCRRARSTILFAGPMAARHGQVTVAPPGGDIIGRRRLDAHFLGLAALGISVHGKDRYIFRRGRFAGAQILLDEASVTATENVLMAAVLAPGTTTVYNAACEPHVQDLCHMLNRMGARIRGIGTNYLRIEGVASLHGVRHRVSGDYIDAASFIAAAAVTGGELIVEGVPVQHLEVIARPFRRLGVKWTVSDGEVRLPANQRLAIVNDFGSAVPKIEDGIWPAFPSDLMSVALVVATQARGDVLFFEKLFESRMHFADRLGDMGARMVQCDPHRIIISGRARLTGIHVVSPDIRAGMAMLIAALCARGESVIDNAQIIDRGYEAVDRRLRKLGADITRAD